MWRLFIRLWLPLILLLLAVLSASSISPIEQVKKALLKRHYLQQYQPLFTQLNERLKYAPVDQWPAKINQLTESFRHSLRWYPLNEVQQRYGDLNVEIQPQQLVYISGEQRALVFQPAVESGIIWLTLKQGSIEKAQAALSGPAELIRQDLQRYPETQWPMLDLTKYGFDASLVLQADYPQLLLDIESGVYSPQLKRYFFSLNSSQYLLVLNPNPVSVWWVGGISILLLFSILAIALWLRLYPWWRDLQMIRQAAASFGDGDLQQRAHLSRHSTFNTIGNTFDQMAEQIQQLIQSQKQLLDSVAHDVRSPLARIRFAVEMLQENNTPEQQQRYQQHIINSTETLEGLIETLLLHARYSSSPQPECFSSINLVDLIEEELDVRQQQLTEEAKQAGREALQLNFISQAAQNRYQLDAQGMQRVLNNLLDNACRFAQSEIRVSLATKGHWYELSIEDDGPGIAEELREQVLQPFHQLQNEARTPSSKKRHEHQGYGLGLPICQQIARWHQGALLISDSELGGAAIRLRWPVDGTALDKKDL